MTEIDRLKAKTICPGCGTLNPVNLVSSDGFSCDACEWEADIPLPTIGQIASGDKLKFCRDVDLSRFLRTLFEQEATND